MLWSFILIPVALLNIDGTARIILGLPFIIFIPGYVLIFALFPTKKTDRGIDILERIALSFGLSIAVVPLIGLGLNYTPWGIGLESVLRSIYFFIIIVGLIAIYRWFRTIPEERFIISLDLSLPKSKSKLDRALTIIIAASIIIASASVIYTIITPKEGEKLTELYILGVDGDATNYPRYLVVGKNSTITIGIANHEHRTIDYNIEVWLINQTDVYNESTDKNKIKYNNMWFMDKINIMLDHTPIAIGGSLEPQWEYNYTFNINRQGYFKLVFLLFTTTTEDYNNDEDYKDIAEQKINSAYRENHLWINVI
jgi:uncharacterized membrane protein